MKRLQSFIIAILAITLLDSCVKNELTVFTTPVVEFDAASWNANGAGLTYPILTRVPAYGRAASSSLDPLLTRLSPGIKKFRINLVGAQLPTDTDVFLLLGAGTTAVAEDVPGFRISTESSPKLLFAGILMEAGNAA